ncbi:tetratricopeptide repeat protein [Edaphobacter bradus]|uniref:tetratricopeptide repeat protein n=1 Tax=Edaphobacter bradus TaxID=2259016 RepID=UPI0021E0A1AC|nr:tetratricopeptide repeat protein [Edaphobacter bradus]
MHPIRSALVAFAFFTGVCRLFAADPPAEELLKQGRIDEAQTTLRQVLAAQPDDANAHLLLCRAYYAQDMGDDAVHECELAASNAPSSSEYQFWLGRAYGLKASQVNMLSAFSIAKKVRVAFEWAVQLDPANVEAMSALGEFYVRAPSIVGGGLDKAQALVAQLQPQSVEKTHRLLALIAEKKNDNATAETEFMRAVAAGRTPEAYIDLSQFYEEQKQADKAAATVQASIQANRAKNASLVDAAGILTTLHRSPDIAERALRAYLASPAKSEDAPAFKVHVQLGDLLRQRGDAAGAQREYAAAVALAPNYAPARKAMQGT